MMIRTEYTTVDVDGVRKNSNQASSTKNRESLLDNLAISQQVRLSIFSKALGIRRSPFTNIAISLLVKK